MYRAIPSKTKEKTNLKQARSVFNSDEKRCESWTGSLKRPIRYKAKTEGKKRRRTIKWGKHDHDYGKAKKQLKKTAGKRSLKQGVAAQNKKD